MERARREAGPMDTQLPSPPALFSPSMLESSRSDAEVNVSSLSASAPLANGNIGSWGACECIPPCKASIDSVLNSIACCILAQLYRVNEVMVPVTSRLATLQSPEVRSQLTMSSFH